jgi:hypothetical protein
MPSPTKVTITETHGGAWSWCVSVWGKVYRRGTIRTTGLGGQLQAFEAAALALGDLRREAPGAVS